MSEGESSALLWMNIKPVLLVQALVYVHVLIKVQVCLWVEHLTSTPKSGDGCSFSCVISVLHVYEAKLTAYWHLNLSLA